MKHQVLMALYEIQDTRQKICSRHIKSWKILKPVSI